MFYGIGGHDKHDDALFPSPEVFVSEEYNGGNRDNDGTVRPRHARSFPGGLWQMIVENGLSRVYLGVHWIFDAFDFVEDHDGHPVPDLTDENIGGVGLGLRIARDIFEAGAGLAPVMTPAGAAAPAIETPPENTVLPVRPRQPAAAGGCIDGAHKGGKKSRRKNHPVQEAFPTGSDKSGHAPSENRDAYPPGRSEK